MKFEEGKIFISFGKVTHEIGTYEEVVAWSNILLLII
jgi:hypothetical protein